MIFTEHFPQAIIFDLDGTLVDSVPDLSRALNKALLELSIITQEQAMKVELEQVRLWVGNGSHKLIERALRQLHIPSDQLENVHEYFLKHYERGVCEESFAYPGAQALLQACQKAQLPMALVTNKPIAFVPALLKKLGLDGFFEVLLGGDSLAEKKPSALPLLHAATSLNVAPDKCLMVGDSTADRAAAKNAGIPCVLLEQGYNQGQDLSKLKPEWLLNNIESLLQNLQNA